MHDTMHDHAPRVAIFHDNFAQMGGAERVAEALHRALPNAGMFTTLSVTERLTPYLQTIRPQAGWMQLLPWKHRLFRHYFLLYPLAIETADLRGYDVIVTSCFGYAKGIRRRSPGSLHVCYCHNPMRWVHRGSDYMAGAQMGLLKRTALKLLLGPLAAWERRAARQPDLYIANSKVVQQRLRETFGIDSEVIPPPIETARFRIADSPEDFYLVLSRLVPYKRIELAVEACTRLNRPLKVVGDGIERKHLEAIAGPTVEFLGRASDAAVNGLVRRCKALLFPGEEDFGITPVEVNAACRPVIAYRAGGATETIVDGLTGVFFEAQTTEALTDAMLRLEAMAWNPRAIRAHAMRFDTAVFQRRIRAAIEAEQERRAETTQADLTAVLSA